MTFCQTSRKMKHSRTASITDLIAFNNSSNTVDFSTKSFQRTYRKFFRFNQVQDKIVYLTTKISSTSLKIIVEEEDYFLCTTSKNRTNYLLYATSTKELVSKLLKYNLI